MTPKQVKNRKLSITKFEKPSDFEGQDILSLDQFTSQGLQAIFDRTPYMRYLVENHKVSHLLKGYWIAPFFFEKSTRTFLSFSRAAEKLGADNTGVSDASMTSVGKGETLADTVNVLKAYGADTIVLRHQTVGAAKDAADATTVPIINAGDGIGGHPTQAILDLYTIKESCDDLNHITGVFAGDLKNGRTVHSLGKGLSLYKGNSLYLLSPKQFRLDAQLINEWRTRGMKVTEIEHPDEIPKEAQFWYWTRPQKERFQSPEEYDALKEALRITPEFLDRYADKKIILMHPLPRNDEIAPSVDNDPRAIYLEKQVANGLYTRMALLSLILGKETQ